MASYAAVLQVTGELAHHLQILPGAYTNAVETLWPEFTAESAEADRAAEALRHTHSWCTANRHLLRGVSQVGSSNTTHRMVGIWRQSTSVNGQREDVLAILPTELAQLLEEGGFEPRAIIRQWSDRGWLVGNAGRRRLRLQLHAGGSAVEMVAIRWQAVRELIGDADDGVSPVRPTAAVHNR